MSELAATAMATARFPRHHALKYRTFLATHLATAVAVAIAVNSDTALAIAAQGIETQQFELPSS